MLGLGDYGSSDEDENRDSSHENNIPAQYVKKSRTESPKKEKNESKSAEHLGSRFSFIEAPVNAIEASALGPILGPSMNTGSKTPLEEESQSPPLSPYSAERAAIRKLTLPPIPNFDIASSPPGSPPHELNAKFERFLELKKQGIHFNEKLEKSSALRNPHLFQKLREYAGISEADQYCSTLPEGMKVPTKFPKQAYPEEMEKARKEAAKRKEEEIAKGQRGAVEFTPATATATAIPKRTSTTERVMAGLDRSGKRSRFDQRERKEGDVQGARASKIAYRG